LSERAEAEGLAVVESNGTQRVVGLLNEAYALRRYTRRFRFARARIDGDNMRRAPTFEPRL
jgi:hypothetical protein